MKFLGAGGPKYEANLESLGWGGGGRRGGGGQNNNKTKKTLPLCGIAHCLLIIANSNYNFIHSLQSSALYFLLFI